MLEVPAAIFQNACQLIVTASSMHSLIASTYDRSDSWTQEEWGVGNVR